MVVHDYVHDKAELAALADGLCAHGLIPLPTERRNQASVVR